MHDMRDLKLLLAIRDNDTLVAAAHQLGLTPSAVTQRLQTIEKRLNVRLIDRSARGLCFTGEGELLCLRGKQLVEQYDALMHELDKRRSGFAGTLKINAPFGFGRRYLAAAAADFQQRYPDVEMSLTLSDRPLVEAAERFDIVIHIGQLRSSSLIGHAIAANRRFVCASPDFIAHHGQPSSPEELARLPCIALRENNEDVLLWHFTRGRTSSSVRVRSTLASNDGDIIRLWATRGLGIIMRSEWDVAEALHKGELVRLMPAWKTPDANVIALTHQREGLPLRTRQFMRFLRERFSPVPPWREAQEGTIHG
ncbi:LysR family transcriptional regulator [Sodalis sp. RH20]|uniref:LysR family transcriptional regulator n=1 Tax=unclassified Sodalis (in: enterobacteria) TaxID=2636512 RepID=UPI0039B581C1